MINDGIPTVKRHKKIKNLLRNKKIALYGLD
jgi:hypothetical protein